MYTGGFCFREHFIIIFIIIDRQSYLTLPYIRGGPWTTGVSCPALEAVSVRLNAQIIISIRIIFYLYKIRVLGLYDRTKAEQ